MVLGKKLQNQTSTFVDGGRGGGWGIWLSLFSYLRHLVSSMKVDPGLSLSGVPGDVQDAPGQVHRLRRPDRPPRTQRRPRNGRKSHFFTRITVLVTKPITTVVTKPLLWLSIINKLLLAIQFACINWKCATENVRQPYLNMLESVLIWTLENVCWKMS